MVSDASLNARTSLVAFKKHITAALLLWTAVVVLSLCIRVASERHQAIELAINEARTSIITDIGFRRWASSHGGVYVPPNEQTPPNIHLKTPDRDVETKNGLRLTLMNPAYMLRQLMQQGYVMRGRITSLKPINPDNAPDPWEALALGRIERGEKEVVEEVQLDGNDAVRVMRPLWVEQGCLKCHGVDGYKLGDLRGGIDVTVKLEHFANATSNQIKQIAFSHAAIFIFVSGLLFFAYVNGRKNIIRQRIAEKNLLITKFSVDHAGDSIYWLTPSGNFSYVNEAACLLLGYQREELLKLKVSDVNPDHPAEMWADHWNDLKAARSLRFPARIRCKDGTLVPVEISANHLGCEGEEFNIAVVRDMREQQAAEHQINKLKDVYAALSHTNKCIIRCQTRGELFNSIVDIAVTYGHFKMAWIGITDKSTKLVNAVASSGDECSYLDGLTISADEESPYGHGPTGQCIQTGVHRVENNFAQSEITTPWHDRALANGFTSSASFPLKNDGVVIGAMTLYSHEIDFFTEDLISLLLEMSMDISFALDRMDLEASHRRQESEMRQMLERLTISNTELERFAYVASHDLQEPLRSIVSFTQLIEKHMKDRFTPDDQENFGFVVSASKRMSLLIQDLLAFSRVSTKGNPFSKVSLSDPCSTAIENLRESIAACGAQIDVGDLPEVFCDEVQMMQVFQNIIGNAVKFRHADRVPCVTICSEQIDGEWIVKIKDNGIGIAPTEQDIFEIFRRLHAGNRYPGSGVGLSICKRIVERHGGRIWVESVPGEGSTFFFTLRGEPIGQAE